MILSASMQGDDPQTYAGDFTYAVAKICQQLGCKLPSQELFTVLFEFHCKFFSSFTIAEVKTAFELHLIGEIPDDKGEKLKHYQNFDCEFYSSIMLLYRKRREKVKVNANTELARIDYEERNVSDNIAAHQRILEQIYDDFNRVEPEVFSIKYDVLEESNIISLTTEQKNQLITDAKELIKRNAIRNAEPKTVKELMSGALESEAKTVAKKLAYIEFLANKSNRNLIHFYE